MSNSTKPGRVLKARTRDVYDNSVHGQMGSSIPTGDRTINTNLCRVNLIRAKQDRKLVLRPWPALDYGSETPTPVFGRLSPKPRHQSHWMIRVPIVKYAGLPDSDCSKFTWLLHRPTDDEGREQNPYRIFYFAAKRAFEAGNFGHGRKWNASWNPLMKGSAKGGAAISAPSAAWFIQGEAYEANGKSLIGEKTGLPLGGSLKDDLVVFQLSDSAGNGMMRLLDREKREWSGDEDANPSLRFEYGDAVGRYNAVKGTCGPGRFFTVFHPKEFEITTHSSWNGTLAVNQGYEVAIASRYVHKGAEYRATLEGERMAAMLEKWQFWLDDLETEQPGLLHFPSIEEQAVYIAQGYWRVARLLEYAWSDRPEFFTDEVRGILNRRKAVVMPNSDGDDDEGDDEEDDAPRQPRRTDRMTAAAARRPAPSDEDEEDFDGGGEAAENPPRTSRTLDDDEDDDGGFDDAGGGAVSPAGGGGRTLDDDDDDEEDEEAGPVGKPATAAGGDGEIEAEEPDAGDEDDGDDDEEEAVGDVKEAEDGDEDAVEAKMRRSMREAGVRSSVRANRPVEPPAPPPEVKPEAARRRPRSAK